MNTNKTPQFKSEVGFLGRNPVQFNNQDTRQSNPSDILNTAILRTKKYNSTNPSKNKYKLIVFIEGGMQDESDNYWIYGYEVGGANAKDNRKNRRRVRVRLNNINESVRDSLKNSSSTKRELEQKFTKLYKTNPNPRKSLVDYMKSGSRLLCFDKVTELGESEGCQLYRAHWTSMVTSSPQFSFVQGLAHISIFKPAEQHQKGQVRIELLESVLKDVAGKNSDSNKEFLIKSLNNFDNYTNINSAQRNSKIIVCLNSETNRFEFDIYSEREETVVFDKTTNTKSEVTKPINGKETLLAFMKGLDYKTQQYKFNPSDYNKSQAIQSDFFRQVIAFSFGLGLDEQLNKVVIAVEDNKQLMIDVATMMHNGQITVNLFGCRLLYLGKKHEGNVLNDSRMYSHYSMAKTANGNIKDWKDIKQNEYAETIRKYATTAVGLQHYEDGTAYAVFDMAIDPRKDSFITLSEVNEDMINEPKDLIVNL